MCTVVARAFCCCYGVKWIISVFSNFRPLILNGMSLFERIFHPLDNQFYNLHQTIYPEIFLHFCFLLIDLKNSFLESDKCLCYICSKQVVIFLCHYNIACFCVQSKSLQRSPAVRDLQWSKTQLKMFLSQIFFFLIFKKKR